MRVLIDSLVDGAARATGVVAVIDVFRAFTSAAVALANGAHRIVMVGSVEEALELRRAGFGEVCIGEVGGRAPEGFDFGNSPSEITSIDLQGKTVIQRTSAGTQGIVLASSRAQRLCRRARYGECDNVGFTRAVTLVAMGGEGVRRADEDEVCAMHLRNRLEGRPGDPDAVRRLILADEEVLRFHDPARPYLHSLDVDIALDVDQFDFAVRGDFEVGRPLARMERLA